MQGDPSNPAPIAGSSAQAMMTLRIVAGAMIAGTTIFLVIAAATRGRKLLADDPWNPMRAITPIALLLAVAVPAAAFAVSNRTLRSTVEGLLSQAKGAKPEPAWPGWPPLSPQLFRAYQTALIIEFAGLEAPAFMNGIAYMIEGSAIAAIVAFCLIAGMASRFPTEGRIRGWMEAASGLS